MLYSLAQPGHPCLFLLSDLSHLDICLVFDPIYNVVLKYGLSFFFFYYIPALPHLLLT